MSKRFQVCNQLQSNGSAELHSLACARVGKSNPRRVQEISAERRKLSDANSFLARRAIESVTDNGGAESRKMNANLMGAAGVEIRFDQREAIEVKARFPIGARFAAFASSRRHACSTVKIACDRQIHGAFFALQFPVQQRHIGFLDEPRLKILYELAMGCIISRNHDRARRFLIEAVDDAGAQRPTDRRKPADAAKSMQ
jgi:hypothetical protein